jgi:hypothetical protein
MTASNFRVYIDHVRHTFSQISFGGDNEHCVNAIIAAKQAAGRDKRKNAMLLKLAAEMAGK